jgi:hypothetical protein
MNAGPLTLSTLMALLAILVGLALLRSLFRGGVLRTMIVAACIAIPSAFFLAAGRHISPGSRATVSAAPSPSVAVHAPGGSHFHASVPPPAPPPYLSVDEAGAGSAGASDDEAERWKRLAASFLRGLSREVVERRWADSPPLTISLGDDLIIIGQAERQADRDVRGSSRRDRDRVARLREQADRAAHESAERQLHEYIQRFKYDASPALEDVGRTLRRLSDADTRRLAAGILARYQPAEQESTGAADSAERPVLRHAYKYEFDRNQFVSLLRDELQSEQVRVSVASSRMDRRGRLLQGLLSAGIIWAVIVASAAALRASAARRRPVR